MTSLATGSVCPRCGAQGDGKCGRCGTGTVLPVIASRFQLTDAVGSDSMGTRWLGTDTEKSQPVHVRLGLPMEDGAALLFQRHSKHLMEIEHHNLPHVLWAGSHGRVPAVVTQVTDGVDLAAEIKKSGALGVQRTTSIATQLLKGAA